MFMHFTKSVEKVSRKNSTKSNSSFNPNLASVINPKTKNTRFRPCCFESKYLDFQVILNITKLPF